MITTLSNDGQVVIPLDVRKQLGLLEGLVMSCNVVGGKIVLDPNPGGQHAELVEENGRLVLVAPQGAPEMTPELIKDILSS